ncbi:MAG: hypothetical protein FJX51_08495 [Alphaproteobacteria bacterium]|nr:hypothetical protein [Alphaproteobacteria bacterium]
MGKIFLKQSLSDAAGQDVEFHENSHEKIVSKVRDFFRVEAGIAAPGAARVLSDYEAFQGWVVEKKIHEGRTEKAAVSLPTRERLDEMLAWIGQGKPLVFRPIGETGA